MTNDDDILDTQVQTTGAAEFVRNGLAVLRTLVHEIHVDAGLAAEKVRDRWRQNVMGRRGAHEPLLCHRYPKEA